MATHKHTYTYMYIHVHGCKYLIAGFINTNHEYKLGYKEIDAQIDVDVVSHAP